MVGSSSCSDKKINKATRNAIQLENWRGQSSASPLVANDACSVGRLKRASMAAMAPRTPGVAQAVRRTSEVMQLEPPLGPA